MNSKNHLIYLNIFIGMAYLILYALRLVIAFKTELEPTTKVIFNVSLMILSVFSVLTINLFLLKKKNKLLQIVQLLFIIVLFMPSNCVVKLGVSGNPVIILALSPVFFATLLLFTNLVMIFKGNKFTKLSESDIPK